MWAAKEAVRSVLLGKTGASHQPPTTPLHVHAYVYFIPHVALLH